MFPDLRLLISATVATFFLAATAGLYASLRITQDQIAATRRCAQIEDAPVTRIANELADAGAEPRRRLARSHQDRDLSADCRTRGVVTDPQRRDPEKWKPVFGQTMRNDVPQDATQSTMPARPKPSRTPR